MSFRRNPYVNHIISDLFYSILLFTIFYIFSNHFIIHIHEQNGLQHHKIQFIDIT